MRKPFSFADFDWLLLILVATIAGLGMLEVYSTTVHTVLASQFRKQIYWVLIGVIITLVVSRLDYHVFVEHVFWIYAATVLGLALVLIAGHTTAGSRRWLRVGSLTFQVSEFAKLATMILVGAYFASKRGSEVTWGDLLKLGSLALIPVGLVAVEPDLGTALTFLPILGSGFFLGGIKGRQIAALALAGLLALPVGWQFLKPYQRERVVSFAHPARDTQGSGYQGSQAKIAIGAGGLWGKGLGQGTQSRLGFIPVSHADFIFASFAEEQGFVGTFGVLLLYFLLLLRLLDGAVMAGDRAGAFLLVGFASLLFFEVAVNVGMMIGFLPITGIPLPLMSEGGSSTLVTFVSLGLVMSVRMRRFVN